MAESTSSLIPDLTQDQEGDVEITTDTDTTEVNEEPPNAGRDADENLIDRFEQMGISEKTPIKGGAKSTTGQGNSSGRTGQKYLKVPLEKKIEIAKYAAENSVKAAVEKYRHEYPDAPKHWGNTIRNWRYTYLASPRGSLSVEQEEAISFDISQVIGKGSNGTIVYNGTLKDGKRVAVKHMLYEEGETFLEEVDKLLCDSHDNIIQYFWNECDGQFVDIALELCLTSLGEYVEGKGKEKLEQEGLKVNKKVILRDSMKGLEHLHKLNIIHRNIKPDNILLTRKSDAGDDEVKAVLSDFGISTQIEPGRVSANTEKAGGTTGWKAPELIFTHEAKKTCTTATDIFAMGCVIYYVLSSGAHPFWEERGNQCKLRAHLNIITEAVNISDDYVGTYPLEELPATHDCKTAEHLIKQMIAKRRDQRPTATQVLSHCYFWSYEKQLNFLMEVSDWLQELKDPTAKADIERDARDVIGNDWKKIIDNEVLVKGIFEHLVELTVDSNGCTHTCEEYGVTLVIPEGAVKETAILQFGVCLYSDQFQFDDDCTPITPIVWACIDQKLMKPAHLTLPHHIDITGIDESNVSEYLTVLKADHRPLMSDGSNGYKFKEYDCTVQIDTSELKFRVNHFCSLCVSRKVSRPKRYCVITATKREGDALYVDVCFLYDQPACIETVKQQYGQLGYIIDENFCSSFTFTSEKRIHLSFGNGKDPLLKLRQGGWQLKYTRPVDTYITKSSINFVKIIKRDNGKEHLKQLEKEFKYPPRYSMVFERTGTPCEELLDYTEIEIKGTMSGVILPIHLAVERTSLVTKNIIGDCTFNTITEDVFINSGATTIESTTGQNEPEMLYNLPPDRESYNEVDLPNTEQGTDVMSRNEGATSSQVVVKEIGSPPTASIKEIGNISYDIEGIGTGSSGTIVYKGCLIKEKRPVAVKCIRQNQEERKSLFKEFEEINKLVRCDGHCNIINFLGYEEDAEHVYIALKLCSTSLGEYVETDEGKDKLRKEGLKVPIDNKAILLGAMEGLEHLHELGIVHRDIKPDNILLTRKSAAGDKVKAVLCDFGISTEIEPGRGSATTKEARGTRGWKAPELCTDESKKKTCTTATDIFGMGCLIYYLLSSGGHPFGGKRGNKCEVKADLNISTEAEKKSDDYVGTYPLEELPATHDCKTAEHLIKQMIAKKREQRPSATQVLGHCYFWSNEMQLDFIQKVSDCLVSKRNPVAATAKADIEKDAKVVIGLKLDWMKSPRIDPVLVQKLSTNKQCKYDGSSLERLLRAIRNLNHHYDEVSSDVIIIKVIGSSSDALLHYFMLRFPHLLVYIYGRMKQYEKNIASLRKFYL